MPEEPNPSPKPEEKPAENNQDAIRAAVAAGVEVAFEKVLEKAGQQQPVRQETRPDPEPTTDEIDRQIDEAIAAGQPIGPLQRQRDGIIQQITERRLVRPLREQGGAPISELATRTLMDKPYYQKLKPKIDGLLARANGPITPQVAEWAYNQVRGENFEELASIERENALRKAQEPAQPQIPTSAGRNQPDEDDENADMATVFGKGTDATFRRKQGESRIKRTQDDEARMMGFTDWKDMLKNKRELEKSEDFSLGLDK